MKSDKPESDEYSTLTDKLLQGPRLKSKATYDLENLVKKLLLTNQYSLSYNSLGELEVRIGKDNDYFNVTKILENNPDFEHFNVEKEWLDKYTHFLKLNSTQFHPTL